MSEKKLVALEVSLIIAALIFAAMSIVSLMSCIIRE